MIAISGDQTAHVASSVGNAFVGSRFPRERQLDARDALRRRYFSL